jgi:poly[(R)-3-hydroxyalkanoate] polymerase subunit PhaC
MTTTTPQSSPAPEEAAELAAPLDSLLIDAALGPLRRFAPDASTAKFALGLARRPRTTGRRLGALAAELARIGIGTSTVAPSKRDRRFADPAWSGNPLLRGVVQAYLATGKTLEHLVDSAGLGWRDEQRMRFLAENLLQAASPSNVALVNPASAKAVIDTGGANLLRGGRNLIRDMAASPRIPAMVDTSAFDVGRNLALTPGAVVLRTEAFELIQYTPATETVREIPLLLVPPMINKFYAIDLAPGRSLVEHLVASGQQVFVISWRNPDARHAAWGLDTYVRAVLEALEAVERICAVDRTVLAGLCAGGVLASITAAYLAGTGQQSRLAALGLAVSVLDNAQSGVASALVNRRLIRLATLASRRRGYLDGRALAEVFAWLRPGDLVWNYWVNNYLLGQKPPAFDLLYWNADTTRMPATLHADFVDMSLTNPLATSGALKVLGVPVDLSRINVDAYVVAGISDHITPWQNCYRSTQLLGGATRFVLSTSGHIQALVNPPGNSKASYQLNEKNPADAQEWLKGASMQQGSWWPDAVAWLSERCGADKPAPEQLGGGGLAPLVQAPGTYVFDT